jgi:hypothetical protein
MDSAQLQHEPRRRFLKGRSARAGACKSRVRAFDNHWNPAHGRFAASWSTPPRAGYVRRGTGEDLRKGRGEGQSGRWLHRRRAWHRGIVEPLEMNPASTRIVRARSGMDRKRMAVATARTDPPRVVSLHGAGGVAYLTKSVVALAADAAVSVAA